MTALFYQKRLATEGAESSTFTKLRLESTPARGDTTRTTTLEFGGAVHCVHHVHRVHQMPRMQARRLRYKK